MLPPIDVSQYGKDQVRELAAHCRSIMEQKIAELDKEVAEREAAGKVFKSQSVHFCGEQLILHGITLAQFITCESHNVHFSLASSSIRRASGDSTMCRRVCFPCRPDAAGQQRTATCIRPQA